MNDMLKNIILWVVIAIVLMSVFNNFGSRKSVDASSMSYSQFLAEVGEGRVKQVVGWVLIRLNPIQKMCQARRHFAQQHLIA